MKNSNKKAFTLVELLVVIAIIGILFVVLISKVDFATDKAKATGVQTDFRSFQLAVETVARENAGFDSLVVVNNNNTPDDETDDTTDYSALVAALNKNLDPKLHITLEDDGTMTIGAKDPWKEVYTVEYIDAAEDEHRGAFVFYCGGANLQVQTTATVVDGDVTFNGTADTAKDDYAIATVYTFTNGYGEVISTSTGFSNNQ